MHEGLACGMCVCVCVCVLQDEGMIVTRAIPGTIDYALNPLAPDWHHVSLCTKHVCA